MHGTSAPVHLLEEPCTTRLDFSSKYQTGSQGHLGRCGVLERLARWCHRERRLVVAAWLNSLVLVAGLAAAFGGALSSSFEAPASESQRALDLLFERFPEQAGAGAEVVFRAEATVDDPAVSSRMERLFAELNEIPGVGDVVSPYDGAVGAFQISRDRSIAFARVQF